VTERRRFEEFVPKTSVARLSSKGHKLDQVCAEPLRITQG
jgi:hypothetical protein